MGRRVGSLDDRDGCERRAMIPKLAPRKGRVPLTRSQMMSRIRSQNTRPEIVTGAAVHGLGIRFRRHAVELPGNPDFVNRRKRWVIFVHGCFWHSHKGCRLASVPKSNKNYWMPKLQRNHARDLQNIKSLRKLGFRVLVLWECQTRDRLVLLAVLDRFFRRVRRE